ncbi:preprotein translocase subunit SecG [Pelagibacteraceae bacterium]|nr:preprotein translocase subunit SecG [Pelagibacteraceae bacterium]
MTTLIVIQLILAVALVILVLIQGSDNEGLGLGGGTSGGMMSARGSANLLSRLTAITATLFMIMSIVLTIAASVGSDRNVLESLPSINTEETSQEPTIPENN